MSNRTIPRMSPIVFTLLLAASTSWAGPPRSTEPDPRLSDGRATEDLAADRQVADEQAPGLTIDQLSGCSATILGVYETAGRSAETQGWMGTAFVVGVLGDSLVMVTNRHCLGIDDLATGGGATGGLSEYGLIIEFPSGEMAPVSYCGFFRGVDLAVLVVPASGLAEGEDYTIVPVYEGDDLGVGDEVAASGSPADDYTYYQGTVTFGRISAFRDLDGIPVIQLDAALNHGNSGGPLMVERDGLYYCIGVNTWGTSDETIEGIGFAIDLSRTGEVTSLDDMVLYTADIQGFRSALADAVAGPAAGRGTRVGSGDEGTTGGRGHRVGDPGSTGGSTGGSSGGTTGGVGHRVR